MLDVECRENKQSTKGQLRNALRKEKAQRNLRGISFLGSRKGANAEIISTHIVMHIIYKKISPELWAVGPTYL